MNSFDLGGISHSGCGGRFHTVSEEYQATVSGLSAPAMRSVFRCDKCGLSRRSYAQFEQDENAAMTAVRTAHNLLDPKQIRMIRLRIGVDSRIMAALVPTAESVFSKWESGRYLQNKEADTTIRLLESDAEFRARRATTSGVKLPATDERRDPSADSADMEERSDDVAVLSDHLD